MHPRLPEFVCESCYEDISEYVDAASIGLATGVDPPPQFPPCDLCREELTGQAYFSIRQVTCNPAISAAIKKQVHACDADGCGRVWDSTDKEWFLDETNNDLLTVLSEHVASLNDGDGYTRLLKWLNANGLLEEVEFPDIPCPKCSSALDGWFQEVKTAAWRRTLPAVPPLPAEITSLPVASLRPEEVIEYYRSDCSSALIHLTKPAELLYMESNLDGGTKFQNFSAGEILYLILVERELKTSRGKGLHAPAVCFTEKPLTALKDTLLGRESSVRRKHSAITWAPYGLMFPKAYLRRFGVAPVLHINSEEESTLPGELKHRIVPFSDRSNWSHEREWRCGQNISFDPAEAIVLLPRFEQVAAFQKALDRAKVAVRGYLPLFDLFASM